MAAPPAASSRLQSMLQAAVQSVQWTYSLFWQFCPQQGVLVWGDGYYNGAIKTRKTVQPMEVSIEETSLQRSQQLRELYDSLSAGESTPPARRPSASLSPEDLTESEWFYLMCVSFSFPPGVGLPGKAYTKKRYVWLAGANEVDSKVFSRAILAKSARVQTVVCIPLLDGVIELGSTERIEEENGFIQQIKSFFVDHHPQPPPKPALSEHSTSNPVPSSDNTHFINSSHLPTTYNNNIPLLDPLNNNSNPNEELEEEDEEDNDEDEDDQEDENDHESESRAIVPGHHEPSEMIMQLEMSEDIRLGSPDDGSNNNLDSDFQLLGVNQAVIGTNTMMDHDDVQRRADESSRRLWSDLMDPLMCNTSLQQLPNSGPILDKLTQEDTHYSQTVSTILNHLSHRWSSTTSPSSARYLIYAANSAFSKWTPPLPDHHVIAAAANSQWLLKYMLFTVPFLHTKHHEENNNNDDNDSSSPAAAESSVPRLRKGCPQDELSANHVLAERRRREKLNERFIVLRSLVPFVTKMDKASILGDTIEYVKQLKTKISDLESKNRQMEIDQKTRTLVEPQRTSSSSLKEPRSGVTMAVTSDKRKMRIVEGSRGAKTKAVESPPPPPPPPPQPVEGVTVQVQVSIIESDALIEMQCPYSEGILLDVMLVLRGLKLEIRTVQSSLVNGIFVAELRAKVKENYSGKKVSIVEVKKAINQIIPQYHQLPCN